MLADDRIQPLDRALDAPECADLLVQSEPWTTFKLSRNRALTVVMDPNKEVSVVRDAAGVSGFIVLDLRGLLNGYIQTLCVRPDRRGAGLGTALVGWAEERIFRESPNVFICVSSFNAGALRLYERLGFQHVGVFREMLIPGHDEYLLRKTAGPWSDFRRRLEAR